jgi:hypothetical protein
MPEVVGENATEELLCVDDKRFEQEHSTRSGVSDLQYAKGLFRCKCPQNSSTSRFSAQATQTLIAIPKALAFSRGFFFAHSISEILGICHLASGSI